MPWRPGAQAGSQRGGRCVCGIDRLFPATKSPTANCGSPRSCSLISERIICRMCPTLPPTAMGESGPGDWRPPVPPPGALPPFATRGSGRASRCSISPIWDRWTAKAGTCTGHHHGTFPLDYRAPLFRSPVRAHLPDRGIRLLLPASPSMKPSPVPAGVRPPCWPRMIPSRLQKASGSGTPSRRTSRLPQLTGRADRGPPGLHALWRCRLIAQGGLNLGANLSLTQLDWWKANGRWTGPCAAERAT